ncbi:NUDIX hydrolase domain-like protein [Polychytrium aggregatum]|uniref:NUDIX hydrolase domain-like protein n=1 Tax=Polychytrium aggregatum TaxID=110093 RepID=UPI0022FEE795|nr:NUDIX hydrolase domain-like protein [Polychytrium aggregatum]KAI9193146.1 NUDIX hydrolase domain-like protein [Polychytrium aggregatum]
MYRPGWHRLRLRLQRGWSTVVPGTTCLSWLTSNQVLHGQARTTVSGRLCLCTSRVTNSPRAIKPVARPALSAFRHLPRMHHHHFASNPLDRLSTKRGDSTFLAKTLSDTSSKFLVYGGHRILVTKDRELALLSRLDLETAGGQSLFEGGEATTLVFLGVDSRSIAYWAIDGTGQLAGLEEPLSQKGLSFASSRPAAFGFCSFHAALFSQAASLLDWNSRNRFCSSCGGRTSSDDGGYKRTCPNAACVSNKGIQNSSYPRTDPVVIACIISKDGERCLLGRKPVWPQGMYSCVAGFMEGGESIEEAVQREAYEETNVRISKVWYHSSQPWPFPAQLMIGCVAQAETEDIQLHDDELEDARWFTREEAREMLSNAEAHDAPATGLFTAKPYAIANTLVKSWVNDTFESRQPWSSPQARI